MVYMHTINAPLLQSGVVPCRGLYHKVVLAVGCVLAVGVAWLLVEPLHGVLHLVDVKGVWGGEVCVPSACGAQSGGVAHVVGSCVAVACMPTCITG